MTFIHTAINFVLHMDTYMGSIISTYGTLTYLLIFLIIFCETGIVFMAVLPGDSFIFATGAFCAIGSLNIVIAFILIAIAAIVGDGLNYIVGKSVGKKLYHQKRINLKANIDKTEVFFAKNGGKAIVIARFIPIIRTFTPFVAGMGKMSFGKFMVYNVFGGILWISVAIFSGYFFGGLPFVKMHFSIIMLGIICVSVVPIIILKILDIKKAKEMI